MCNDKQSRPAVIDRPIYLNGEAENRLRIGFLHEVICENSRIRVPLNDHLKMG